MEGARAEQPQRSRRPEEPELLRTLRQFVSKVLGTKYRNEVFIELTNLFHVFNRNRFAIREMQIKIWSDYVSSCQTVNRSKVEIVRNITAIETRYLALQRKQSNLGLIFMSTFHVVLDLVSGAHTHKQALMKIETSMSPVYTMCVDMWVDLIPILMTHSLDNLPQYERRSKLTIIKFLQTRFFCHPYCNNYIL